MSGKTPDPAIDRILKHIQLARDAGQAGAAHRLRAHHIGEARALLAMALLRHQQNQLSKTASVKAASEAAWLSSERLRDREDGRLDEEIEAEIVRVTKGTPRTRAEALCSMLDGRIARIRQGDGIISEGAIQRCGAEFLAVHTKLDIELASHCRFQ